MQLLHHIPYSYAFYESVIGGHCCSCTKTCQREGLVLAQLAKRQFTSVDSTRSHMDSPQVSLDTDARVDSPRVSVDTSSHTESSGNNSSGAY